MSCQRCENAPTETSKDKYCQDCKKIILEHLKAVGYLETRGRGQRKGASRTNEMKENQHETKYGRDG